MSTEKAREIARRLIERLDHTPDLKMEFTQAIDAYGRAEREAGRLAGLEEAAAHHEEMAIGALGRNHVGSTNDERRDNRAIADWHTTAARLIRGLAQRPDAEEKVMTREDSERCPPHNWESGYWGVILGVSKCSKCGRTAKADDFPALKNEHQPKEPSQ